MNNKPQQNETQHTNAQQKKNDKDSNKIEHTKTIATKNTTLPFPPDLGTRLKQKETETKGKEIDSPIQMRDIEMSSVTEVHNKQYSNTNATFSISTPHTSSSSSNNNYSTQTQMHLSPLTNLTQSLIESNNYFIPTQLHYNENSDHE